MSRDLKPKKNTAKKAGGGTLIGLFIGLVIGVLGAAGVVWYINKMPMPFSTKSAPPPAPPAAGAGAGADKPAKAVNGSEAAPLALPGKPGDPVPSQAVVPAQARTPTPPPGESAPVDDKPRFDFYKILPGNQPAAGPTGKPPATPGAANKPESKAATETALKEPIFLQAGSFQASGDADNQKAKLAMMGLEASIQQVMLQDKVWYRVRLGPYPRLDDVNRIRAELARQGVEASVMKKD